MRELCFGVICEHEPIGPLYAPRLHFRAYARPESVLAEGAVVDHLSWIETLKGPYVETGWPLFGAGPPLMAQAWASVCASRTYAASRAHGTLTSGPQRLRR